MSAERAQQLVHDYIERVWNRGDTAAMREMTTPDFRYHLGGQPALDYEQFARFIELTRVAFPDWRVEIEDTIATAEAVAVRWNGHVTHKGPFRGIEPTGQTVAVSGINTYTIREDKIAVEWEQTDSLGMLQQLGVLPG